MWYNTDLVKHVSTGVNCKRIELQTWLYISKERKEESLFLFFKVWKIKKVVSPPSKFAIIYYSWATCILIFQFDSTWLAFSFLLLFNWVQILSHQYVFNWVRILSHQSAFNWVRVLSHQSAFNWVSPIWHLIWLESYPTNLLFNWVRILFH